jgi:hypothetical protein
MKMHVLSIGKLYTLFFKLSTIMLKDVQLLQQHTAERYQKASSRI